MLAPDACLKYHFLFFLKYTLHHTRGAAQSGRVGRAQRRKARNFAVRAGKPPPGRRKSNAISVKRECQDAKGVNLNEGILNLKEGVHVYGRTVLKLLSFLPPPREGAITRNPKISAATAAKCEKSLSHTQSQTIKFKIPRHSNTTGGLGPAPRPRPPRPLALLGRSRTRAQSAVARGWLGHERGSRAARSSEG